MKAGSEIFWAAKSITARQAAEVYGIQVERSGMALCPFHADQNPSMKVDSRFHCFACGADGDAVDLVARLLNIPAIKAAQRLLDAFGIPYTATPAQRAAIDAKQKRIVQQQELNAALNAFWQILVGYRRQLLEWQRTEAPMPGAESLNAKYVESLHELPFIEYLMDCFLLEGTEARQKMLVQFESEVAAYGRNLIVYQRSRAG